MRVRVFAWVTLCLLLNACSADQRPAEKKKETKDTLALAAKAAVPASTIAATAIGIDTAQRTLATATIGVYHDDSSRTDAGSVNVQISSTKALPADTIITPNRETTKCKPFVDATFPGKRGTEHNSVGNAVAWLVGLSRGNRDEAPRRVNLRLEKCQLQPRVQRVPMGATIIVNNRDDSPSDLRLVEVGKSAPRMTLHFTEPGQVVPSADALTKAGLIEVLDARHPWLRAYIAVAPHPFVAVTGADGKISWENVPAGSYQLVVWHERFGARVLPAVVTAGKKLELRVDF